MWDLYFENGKRETKVSSTRLFSLVMVDGHSYSQQHGWNWDDLFWHIFQSILYIPDNIFFVDVQN